LSGVLTGGEADRVYWWFWWIVVFFMVGGFTKAGDMMRVALRTRHQRRLELAESTRREREALEQAQKPPPPVCGCGHHLAKHDKQGKCHERVEVPMAWDAHKQPLRYGREQCTCQQYVGPQPLTTLYAEDLTDLP
jgi:hypothetical protein